MSDVDVLVAFIEARHAEAAVNHRPLVAYDGVETPNPMADMIAMARGVLAAYLKAASLPRPYRDLDHASAMGRLTALGQLLPWLAWPYRSHPDWRSEWAPEGAIDG